MATLEIKPYRCRLQTPYRWSKGIQEFRAGLILRADIDGAIGWGEAALPPHVVFPESAMAENGRTLLAGLDPGDPDFLEEVGLRECPPRLRCGISMAVLTARARAAGQSLVRYVVGDRRPLPQWVPVNDLIGDASPEACVQRALAALERGQDTVKVKCTPERELDLARIAAIRAACPTLKIRIDPNESWPLEWAAEHLNAMARFDIEYVEEPLPRGTSLDDYARLRRACTVPIALDDSVRSTIHVEHIADRRAADVLILKAQRLGGPDRLLAVVQRAEANGLACTVTASLESSVGLYLGIHCAAMTSLPIAAAGIGTARYFAENVDEPPAIERGRMRVPQEPGLGFDPTGWWDGH
jgi:o-succinylbenzoate synthase